MLLQIKDIKTHAIYWKVQGSRFEHFLKLYYTIIFCFILIELILEKVSEMFFYWWIWMHFSFCVCVCFSDKIECFLYYITTVKQFNYIIFACVDVILFLLYFERNYFRKDILVSFLLFVMVYVYIYSFRSFYQKLLKMIEFWYIWMLLFLYDGYEWFL